MEPAVEIIDVTKCFGDTQAVKSINLKIAAGEFFSLLGPSGCGKTTLLRMIAGFEEPDQGAVKVAGVDMTHVAPHKRPVNMVFQNYALFPHLTVFDNVAFGLKIAKRYQPSQINEMVHEALALVRLPDFSKRYPAELSGGQQQRVAFARAIVNKPCVLLLDEPLSALDPKTRQEMQEELARFKKELSMTFVMVTHDQTEAFALSDRIAVLAKGNLEQVGSPLEIYNQPKTIFVADFIGQSNLFDAKVSEVKNDHVKVDLASKFSFWCKLNPALSAINPGQAVKIWIRNDSLLNNNNGSNTDSQFANSFVGQIKEMTFLGSDYHFKLALADDLVLSASYKNDSRKTFSVGDQIEIFLPSSDIGILTAN